MSVESHELALMIINTAGGYEVRCKMAMAGVDFEAWLQLVRRAARQYCRDFATPEAQIFSETDLRECAQEVAEYYRDHAHELGGL